ncbi:hypothetical protein ACWGII_23215 [Streptomyces sp. NPDC054855]
MDALNPSVAWPLGDPPGCAWIETNHRQIRSASLAVINAGWYLDPDDFTGSDHAIRVWDLLTLSSTVIDLPAGCTGVAAAGQLLVCTFGKDIATFELRSGKAHPSV